MCVHTLKRFLTSKQQQSETGCGKNSIIDAQRQQGSHYQAFYITGCHGIWQWPTPGNYSAFDYMHGLHSMHLLCVKQSL